MTMPGPLLALLDYRGFLIVPAAANADNNEGETGRMLRASTGLRLGPSAIISVFQPSVCCQFVQPGEAPSKYRCP